MIGVINKPGQAAVVAEFFELFKTPWEFYRHGCSYDVVVSTADAMPHPMPRLFISYGAEPKDRDAGGAVPDRSHPGGLVAHGDWQVPIYAGLLTFKTGARATTSVTADVGVVGISSHVGGSATLRVGYDLFEETRFLLSTGQPVEHAHTPGLDLHIAMLRQWILDAGIPIVEIQSCPAGYDFAVCLTHDIDFIGIRRHLFDHTMWGFLYRSTIGALYDAIRRRIPVSRLAKTWRAAASLPFVYLGWVKDFWEPFDWYLETEKGLPATYYLIPFKRRPGDRVSGNAPSRRGTAYDVSDMRETALRLVDAGCEVGVHGIDAWHDASKGRDELARISAVTGEATAGIRMHWLLQDGDTPAVLERAGFAYDSTAGYNETPGYRNGTTQVFRPLNATTLLELPMHVQDGALFYPQRLNLSEPEAEERCARLIDHARRCGGVLTVLWHDRSHGPERFWGEFYRRLVQTLRSSRTWFGTGSQVVRWFRQRRSVSFQRADGANTGCVTLQYHGEDIQPPLRVRISYPPVEDARGHAATVVDVAWNGLTPIELDPTPRSLSSLSEQLPATVSL